MCPGRVGGGGEEAEKLSFYQDKRTPAKLWAGFPPKISSQQELEFGRHELNENKVHND